jgi:hypothetical protein
VQGYRLDDRGFESWQSLGIFLFTTVSRRALGPTQSHIWWLPRALSLGVKWPGCEADHSLPPSIEVKNSWSYTPLPQYAFMAWCSVKAQGQIYLYHNHIGRKCTIIQVLNCGCIYILKFYTDFGVKIPSVLRFLKQMDVNSHFHLTDF